MTPMLNILTGLLLAAAAGLLLNNEYNARRNSVCSTVVLGNSFVGAIIIFVGIIHVAVGIGELLSR